MKRSNFPPVKSFYEVVTVVAGGSLYTGGIVFVATFLNTDWPNLTDLAIVDCR